MRDYDGRQEQRKFWEGFPGQGTNAFAEGFSGHLAAAGGIDELALQRAQRAARESGERLDHVLGKLGLIAENELAARLASYLGIRVMEAG